MLKFMTFYNSLLRSISRLPKAYY